MKLFKFYSRCIYHLWFNWTGNLWSVIAFLFFLGLPILSSILNHALHKSWPVILLMFFFVPLILLIHVKYVNLLGHKNEKI
jgi:hypothetical protein